MPHKNDSIRISWYGVWKKKVISLAGRHCCLPQCSLGSDLAVVPFISHYSAEICHLSSLFNLNPSTEWAKGTTLEAFSQKEGHQSEDEQRRDETRAGRKISGDWVVMSTEKESICWRGGSAFFFLIVSSCSSSERRSNYRCSDMSFHCCSAALYSERIYGKVHCLWVWLYWRIRCLWQHNKKL